jgi:hypothetical protein
MSAITIDQTFPTFSELNIALEDWSIATKFTFRVIKSDAGRTVVKCALETCPFHLRAYFDAQRECVVIGSTMIPDHNCLGAALSTRGTANRQSWLQRVIPTIISVTKDTKPQAIIEAIQLRFQERINYNSAFKAKNALLEDDTVAHLAQFRLLPVYIHALLAANPNTHAHFSINAETNRFQRVFIAPPTSRNAFKHSRPLVALDGTFSKGTFSHVLLLAVCLDAENHIILLAWAIVESENESSWRYFLSHLKQSIPEINQPTTTVISDRDKGLTAADDEISLAGRLFCVQHIGANVKTRFGIAAQAAFKRLTNAFSIDTFQHFLREFQELNKPAADYVMAIDLNMWAPPYTTARCYGHRTSNIVESINAHLTSERRLTCIEILNCLWNKSMNDRFVRQQECITLDQTETLGKYAILLLRKSLENSQHRAVNMSDESNGVVTGFNTKHYIVNFLTQSCSCGWFQQHGVPCGHAIACLHRMNRSPREWIPYNLTRAAYTSAYTSNHLPIDVSRLAALPEAEPISEAIPCRAPQMKNPRGRPQGRPDIARKERGVRLRRGPIPAGGLPDIPNHAPQQCTVCHKRTGHNKRTCRAPPAV